MILAVASDAHGARRRMDALLDALPRVDAFCFLGDMDRDAVYLQYGMEEKQPWAAFYAVVGNNDMRSMLPATMDLMFGDTRVLLTHGHLFRVKSTLPPLARAAAGRGAALALFGHTHIQHDSVEQGVRLVNPGALMSGDWALVTLWDEEISVSLRELPG